MHPDDACALIRAEARAAVESLAQASAPSVTLPATLDVTFRNADLAEMATWITGVTRTSAVTVSMHDDDPIRLFRTFVTTVLLTRNIAE